MDSIKESRSKWIDLSKAICIYFVVLGHALSYKIGEESYFRNFIYMFHLPVFFFVSGYLFRIKENKIVSFVFLNIKSLIVPYIFLNILAFVIGFPFYSSNILSSLRYFLIGHGYAPAGPAWFLLCLFWVKIQLFFVSKLGDRAQLFIALLYGFIAYYFPWRLWWSIDASFMAMPIVILGYWGKNRLSGYLNKQYPILLLVGVFFISLIATVGLSLIQNKEAMFSRMFGTHGVLFYVGALIGIVMIVSLCKLLEKWGGNKIVLLLSSGSIIIMGLHLVFYKYTVSLFNKLSIQTFLELNIPIKVIICIVVLAEMYLPIKLLQKYCSQFLGGRK